MKIKRSKKANKTLKFYSNNFGFRKPFQVLIDGTFCFASLQNRVQIKEQLTRYFDSDVKLLTTKCIIMETELLGKKFSGTTVIVKKFGIHRCDHDSKSVPGSTCFKSMIGENNPNRYIIATQDRELQDVARSVPGTPVLYLFHRTPVLDDPSETSLKVAQDKNNASFGLSKTEGTYISQLKKEAGISNTEVIKKKKKKGGPNPLSCLKSKKKQGQGVQLQDNPKRKRNRQRLKIAEHVKAELFKNLSQ